MIKKYKDYPSWVYTLAGYFFIYGGAVIETKGNGILINLYTILGMFIIAIGIVFIRTGAMVEMVENRHKAKKDSIDEN